MVELGLGRGQHAQTRMVTAPRPDIDTVCHCGPWCTTSSAQQALPPPHQPALSLGSSAGGAPDHFCRPSPPPGSQLNARAACTSYLTLTSQSTFNSWVSAILDFFVILFAGAQCTRPSLTLGLVPTQPLASIVSIRITPRPVSQSLRGCISPLETIRNTTPR